MKEEMSWMYLMGTTVLKCNCTCLRFAVTKTGVSVTPLYWTTRQRVLWFKWALISFIWPESVDVVSQTSRWTENVDVAAYLENGFRLYSYFSFLNGNVQASFNALKRLRVKSSISGLLSFSVNVIDGRIQLFILLLTMRIFRNDTDNANNCMF